MEYRLCCGAERIERRGMKSNFSVAIDGPSGAGKSTLAKRTAQKFGFIYVDTGAIYRTLGLYCFMNDLDCKDNTAVSSALPYVNIEVKYDSSGFQNMYLNGRNVSSEIRKPEISICASDVSSLEVSRIFLLDMQRNFAREHSVVMDGRDIGTVVLPNANVKIFLTAKAEKRAERRLAELINRGIATNFEDVLSAI